MNNDDKTIDILLIEDSNSVIDLFSVLTKKFDIKIKYAKNSYDFMTLARDHHFKYVLCDLNLDYKYEGYFISRIYSNIRKVNHENGKILLFSAERETKEEFLIHGFDGSLDKNFLAIYEFLLHNFPLRSFHDLIKEHTPYSVPSTN